MFRNYLKIAFRNFIKNPAYSFINVAGLSAGIACSMLIMLWVWDEVTFDQSFPNYQQVYQVKANIKTDNGIATGNEMVYPLLETLPAQDSRIEQIALTNWGEGALVSKGDKRLSKFGMWTTTDFLSVLGVQLLKGDAARALTDPTSIVITQSTAESFFGTTDPINQTLTIDNDYELKVTGVMADLPSNSSFQFDFLIPFAQYEAHNSWVKHAKTSWNQHSFQLFVKLKEGVNPDDISNRIRDLEIKNTTDGRQSVLFLHAMSRWHLYGRFENGKEAGGQIEYVRTFLSIAVLIIVIACINFMNLSTARSESRAREVGIRKSLGSRRKELVFQFLGESVLMAIISTLVALLIVELALPLYQALVNKQLAIHYSHPFFWGGLIALIVFIGLLAGSYPAFYLSSFKAVTILKGKIKLGKYAATPRQVLVVLQFGFAIMLMISTLVIYQQFRFVQNRDMGYERENLMMIWTTSDLNKNFEGLKQELISKGLAESACTSNSPITRIFATNLLDSWPGKEEGARIEFSTVASGYDYTRTMGIKLVEGRDFSQDFKSDTAGMVINQAAVDAMALKNPVGAKIGMWNRQWEVIGVMENVVMDSPFRSVDPLVMIMDPTWCSTINVRLKGTSDLKNQLAQVETIFKKYNPAYPFEFRFADWEFDKKFSSVNLIGNLAGIFTLLAIFITCLGLFGLAAFTAEQRTKEIGIRKVLGATVSSLVFLISKDFSRLVIFAFLAAGPLAWFWMNDYLQRYPYRIEVSWWVFPVVGGVALLLALLIVSAQALRAAVSNPTDSLRSE